MANVREHCEAGVSDRGSDWSVDEESRHRDRCIDAAIARIARGGKTESVELRVMTALKSRVWPPKSPQSG